ncbi:MULTISPECIES: hypothetical protein [Photorhabdus]|uniref:Cupin n=2 Tax=Photorhabdus TaxID=29487 RepID=A0A2S8PU11_9GAMM|nr:MULTISPECIES: hypothetical protein [Photorhabdus]OCA53909.1 hypothetical protein Phpb_03013 [Photorhabdus namnaonensis]PQQ22289.1 hypothetical protein C6H66_24135 [Photorhabdus hindustanensis]
MKINQVKFNENDLVKVSFLWMKNNPSKIIPPHRHDNIYNFSVKINGSFHCLNKYEEYKVYSIGTTGTWLVIKDENLNWIFVDCDEFREIFIKV